MFKFDGSGSVVAEFRDGSVIRVWHDGAEYDADMNDYRQRYAYVIVAGNDAEHGWPYGEGRHGWRYDGNDIFSGCREEVDLMEAARSLCSFLTASAEAYNRVSRGYESENYDLFPEHVAEWAYMNDDELALMSTEAFDYE